MLLRTICRQSSPLSQFWMRIQSTGSLLQLTISNDFIWLIGLAMLNIIILSPILFLMAFMSYTINQLSWLLSLQKKLQGVSQTIPSSCFSLITLSIRPTAASNFDKSLPMVLKKLMSLPSIYIRGISLIFELAYLMAIAYFSSQLCSFQKIG